MIDIRPVSDLINHFSEIEELTSKQNKPVYLTKDGYGTMVVLSLEKYSDLINGLDIEQLLYNKFGNIDIEKVLDEMDDEIHLENNNFLSHESIFSKLRRNII